MVESVGGGSGEVEPEKVHELRQRRGGEAPQERAHNWTPNDACTRWRQARLTLSSCPLESRRVCSPLNSGRHSCTHCTLTMAERLTRTKRRGSSNASSPRMVVR